MSFITVQAYAHKRAMEREAREVAEREAREATAPIRTLLANHLVVGAYYAIEAAKAEAAEAAATEIDLTLELAA